LTGRVPAEHEPGVGTFPAAAPIEPCSACGDGDAVNLPGFPAV
jgi:hypothetical protein